MSTEAAVEALMSEPTPPPAASEPAAAPAQEPVSADAPAVAQEPPPVDFTKYVERDHMTAALRELREKGRAERTQSQNEMAALRQQLDELRRPKAEPDPSKNDPMPDPETDPMGAVKWLTKQARLQEQQAQARQQAEAQASQVTQQQAYVLNQYNAAAQDFIAGEPAFAEAYGFIREHRARELAGFGVTNIQAALQREEYQLAEAALANGRNPAQALFEAAKLRGFRPGAADPAPQPGAAARDPATGQFVAQAAPPPQPKVPTIPKSLSGIPGTPGGQVTGAALAERDTGDFDKMMGGDFSKNWRKIVGGKKG
jgi:hypothetical protein